MKNRRGRILLPLGILLLSLAGIFAARVYSAAAQLRRDVAAFQSLSGDSADRIAQLEPLAVQVVRDYRNLRGALGPSVWLAPLLSWLPVYGGDLGNAPALFELGDQVIAGMEDALPVLNALEAKTTAPPAAALLSVIQSNQSLIESLRREYAAAAKARARIDVSKLSGVTRRVMDPVNELLLGWRLGLDVAEIAPLELEGERSRVYLLLAQNSDELRPTGGFITGVALVRVQRGAISVTDFQDSYAVDDLSRFHPQPPAALAQYMFAERLLLRDSNWFPDFPTSARAALNIYRIDRGVSADGVIAVNFKGLPRWIDAVGGVTVEPGSEAVSAENVMDKVRTYWAPPANTGPTPEWWSRRKDFMGQLLEAVIQKIRRGDYSRPKMLRALSASVVAKDLLVYLKDVDAGKHSNLLWDGALSAGPGDALMLVDSNVGFNKVDGTIQRRAEYAPTVERDGSIHAFLTITYTNLSAPDGKPCVHQPIFLPNYADLQQGCYWDYVRVITPAGSQWIRSEGLEDPVIESPVNGRAVLAGFFVLGRGETRVVRWEYTEPANAQIAARYGLTLEKQPGAPTLPVLVRVTQRASAATEISFMLDRDEKISVEPDSMVGLIWVGAFGVSVAMIGATLWLRRRSFRRFAFRCVK